MVELLKKLLLFVHVLTVLGQAGGRLFKTLVRGPGNPTCDFSLFTAGASYIKIFFLWMVLPLWVILMVFIQNLSCLLLRQRLLDEAALGV